MVPCLVVLLVVGILAGQPAQRLLAELQVVQLVLEDDARMKQTVLDEVVALGFLFVGEGDLCQVVFAIVRVVGGTIGWLALARSNRVAEGSTLGGGQTVCGFRCICILCLLRTVWQLQVHHRLVDALPVVLVLALAPLPLEGLLTLADCLGIIEIPLARRNTGFSESPDNLPNWRWKCHR